MQSRSSARKAPLTLHFYLISLQVQAFIDCFNNKIATANCVHKGSFEKYQQRIGWMQHAPAKIRHHAYTTTDVTK